MAAVLESMAMALLATLAYMSYGLDDEHFERVRLWRLRRTRARDVADGAWVKVSGTIEAAGTTLAPLTGEACVYHVSTAVVPGREVLDRGGLDFWLRDDTGRVRVSIRRLVLSRVDEIEWRAGVLAEPHPQVRAFLQRNQVGWERRGLHRPIFCSETLLTEGQALTVFGRARLEPDPDPLPRGSYRSSAGRNVLEGTQERPLLASPGRRRR
jgi:hypothetical protein